MWVVTSLQRGLIESQISAAVVPSSNYLQKGRADSMSFQIITAAAITVLFVAAYKSLASPWLRAPFLHPFSTLRQRSVSDYANRRSCSVSHSHKCLRCRSSCCYKQQISQAFSHLPSLFRALKLLKSAFQVNKVMHA